MHLIDRIVQLDVMAIRLLYWPAILIGLIGLGLALFGQTYEEAEGEGGLTAFGKIRRRRITKIGWSALFLLLVAFGLGTYHQYRMNLDEMERQWKLDTEARANPFMRPWTVGSGSAGKSEVPPPHASFPKPYRLIVDSAKREEKAPLLVKNLDLVDYQVHCPTENLDWTCSTCGFAFNDVVVPIQNRNWFKLTRSNESPGKDQVLLSGEVQVRGLTTDEPVRFAAVGFGSCKTIDVSVRRFPPRQPRTS